MNLKQILAAASIHLSKSRELLQYSAYRASIYVDRMRRVMSQRSARWLPPHRQAGAVSVEIVAWLAITLAIISLVGGIVTGKLETMANSLPSTLDW